MKDIAVDVLIFVWVDRKIVLFYRPLFLWFLNYVYFGVFITSSFTRLHNSLEFSSIDLPGSHLVS